MLDVTTDNYKKCAHYEPGDFISSVFRVFYKLKFILTNKYKNPEVYNHLISQTDSLKLLAKLKNLNQR